MQRWTLGTGLILALGACGGEEEPSHTPPPPPPPVEEDDEEDPVADDDDDDFPEPDARGKLTFRALLSVDAEEGRLVPFDSGDESIPPTVRILLGREDWTGLSAETDLYCTVRLDLTDREVQVSEVGDAWLVVEEGELDGTHDCEDFTDVPFVHEDPLAYWAGQLRWEIGITPVLDEQIADAVMDVMPHDQVLGGWLRARRTSDDQLAFDTTRGYGEGYLLDEDFSVDEDEGVPNVATLESLHDGTTVSSAVFWLHFAVLYDTSSYTTLRAEEATPAGPGAAPGVLREAWTARASR